MTRESLLKWMSMLAFALIITVLAFYCESIRSHLPADILMTDEEKRVAELIRKAFHGVTLGDGVGLMEAQGLDAYAGPATLAEYRSQDEKDDWSAIPVSELNSCSSSLSFFDAEGMRFHLPAYLIADLEGQLTTVSLEFHLTYTGDNALSRFSQLSDSQHNAVREYLLLRLSDSNYEFERPMIQEALNSYWTARDSSKK